MCTPCYEAQLVILKEDTVSTDDDLRSLISELKASIKSEDDILNQATYSTAVYVGERLLMQQCLLLPSVNETFSSFVSELACVHKRTGSCQISDSFA